MFRGRSIVRLVDPDDLGNVRAEEFRKNDIVLLVILKPRRSTTAAESVHLRAKNGRRSWTRKSRQQRSVRQLSAAGVQESKADPGSWRFQTYSECRYDVNLFIPLETTSSFAAPKKKKKAPDINVHCNMHVRRNVDRQCDLRRGRSIRRAVVALTGGPCMCVESTRHPIKKITMPERLVLGVKHEKLTARIPRGTARVVFRNPPEKSLLRGFLWVVIKSRQTSHSSKLQGKSRRPRGPARPLAPPR